MNIDNLKLKHIDLLTGENINYMKLLESMFNYRHTFFNRIFKYKKVFKELYFFIKHYNKLKPEDLEYIEGIKIKKPNSIDEITFIAMMELNMFYSNDENNKKPIGELMGEIISIVCYSANVNQDFDIDSYSFGKFRNRVMNEPGYQMIGLYNWIDKSLKESTKLWSELFFQVEVIDKDYVQAGGNSMKAFNVINSIRSICEDFNLTYTEAWQIQYSIAQASSLSKATAACIQDKMATIKEARMKSQQKSKGL